MVTYIIMAVIVIFLAFTLLYKIELKADSSHFFDKTNSAALRGFWCLIVVLVHIPMLYQNLIQDMLGSFAYIGVTFFFMTSAFGLKISVESIQPCSKKLFWRRRLLRLLVPCFLTNVLNFLFCIAEKKTPNWRSLIAVNGWVKWLIVCYFFFWVAYRLPRCEMYRDVIICGLIIVFSLTVYIFKDKISSTTWCPEIFGFVWGIVLYNFKEKLIKIVYRKWLSNCILLCLLAGILGIAYLKFKPVVFFGDYLLKIVLGVAITAFMLAINTKAKIGNRVSLFLGDISFEVYLLHGTVFGLISYSMPNVESGVFIVTSLIITVALSAVTKWLADMISGKIESIWI